MIKMEVIMKDLEINEEMTLHVPDIDGDVEIKIFSDGYGWNSEYVPFEELVKWVASITEQIIKSSKMKI